MAEERKWFFSDTDTLGEPARAPEDRRRALKKGLDFLADPVDITNIDRVDTEEKHGWEFTARGNGDDRGYQK